MNMRDNSASCQQRTSDHCWFSVASTLFSPINSILAENTRFRLGRNVACARDVSTYRTELHETLKNNHLKFPFRPGHFFPFLREILLA